MEEFLVPLQAVLFAQALNKEILEVLNNTSKCDTTLLYLCLGRLVQLWSHELPLDLWCNILAPTLLHILKTCSDNLKKSTSISSIPLLKSCASCIVTIGNYLRSNITILDKGNTDKDKPPTLVFTTSHGDPLHPIGSSFAELLDSAGPVLSSVVFQCIEILNTRNLGTTAEKEDGSTAIFDGTSVCDIAVRTLEAATALLASISLLLGEEAHIERVRVREFVSSQEETPPGAVTPNASASAVTLGGSNTPLGSTLGGPLGTGSKAPSPTVSSPDLDAQQHQHLIALQNKILSKRAGYANGETVARLELAREAIRCGQHRLLASLVGCCHVDVARCTPRAALSALSALHLLIGMESDDEDYPAPSCIFSYPPTRTLVDILCSLGLPEIALETSILCLNDFTALSSSSAPPSSGTDDVDQDPPTASHLKSIRTSRWSTHPLFTTDRYIRSGHPPVQFLPSPRPCSSTVCATDEDWDSDYDPVSALDSLPKALHDILENAAAALKQKFRKSNTSEKSVIGRRRSGSSFVLMGPTVARECIELLRLMAICPLPSNDIQTSKKSNVTSSLSAGIASNDVIETGYPIATTAISISKLNIPIGHSLEQLLTAPMLFAMMTDAPLFLHAISSPIPIHRPIILWNPQMRLALATLLKSENKVHLTGLFAVFKGGLGVKSADDDVTATAPSSSSNVEVLQLGEESTSEKSLARSTLHSQLSIECLVDNVYIRFLAHPAKTTPPPLGPKTAEGTEKGEKGKEDMKDDIGARDLARFLESLQRSISSSKRVIEHLTKASKSSQLGALKAQLVLKESILSQMLADHDELGYGYSDLYLD